MGRWADAGMLLAVLLISFMSYITVRSTEHAEVDSDWVAHTQIVQKTLDSALGDAYDTVSSSRGFALTGQDTFLDVEARARRRLDGELDTLRRLMADNAEQHARFAQLQAQVNASLESSIRIESARQRTGAAPSNGDLIDLKRSMEAVKVTIGAMQDEETSLLLARRNDAQNARHSILIVVWLSAVVGVGLLTLSGFFLRRQINRAASMDTKLRILNEDLERTGAESRRAATEAKRNQLRLEAAAESSMDCIYFADAVRDANGEIEDFVFTYVNRNALRLVTFSMEEMIGGRMCEMFAVNRKIGLFDGYKNVVLTGESFVGEFAIQEDNIRTAWLRVQATSLGDGVAITASDVSERKEREEAIRRSEALLARTQRLTDTGGWEIDLATNEVFWSAEVYRIQGVAPGYRPTMRAGIECYIPEDRLRIVSAMKTAMAGGEGWDMECTLARGDGSLLPVRVVGEAEFQKGKLIRLAGALTDITQKIAERDALTAARDRLSATTALLERTERLTNTGGWEIDLATSEVFWSAEVRRIQGLAPDYRPTLETGIEFYIPEDRLRVRIAIETAVADGDVFDMECTVVRADGRRVPVRVVGAAQFENGKPTRLAGGFKDITQEVAERKALTAAKDRLSLATDSGGIGIWDWDIARNILCWDHWMYRIYGMQPREEEEPYDVWLRHLHPEDRESAERQLQDGLNGVKPFNTVFRIRWDDGSVHHIHATAVVTYDEAGRPARMIGTNSDVTAQKENEAAIAKMADFMQSIIASSPFATIVTDMQGVMVSVNPAAERMLWYRREDLINLQTPLVLLSSEQVATRAAILSEELQSDIEPGISVLTANPARGKLEEAEWELIRRDGSRFDAQLTVSALTDARSAVIGYILIAYDITERKRAQEYISHLAQHDELTGLPTRTLFQDRLEAALARAMRYQRKVGLLMVDLDNFKKVNDHLGHKGGDELLIVVARRLQSCVRACDTVARMGGDEFMILLDELGSAEGADMVAEKIVKAIAMPVVIGSRRVSQTVSIGVSVYPDTGSTAAALFTNADAAMYRAKAEGRNGRQTYSPELALTASRTRDLEEGLSQALALNEFELVYQPQISMKTGMVTGVEALLRWRSGKLGFVMPGEFIPLAEENGMIVPIGEWVLRTACHQGRQLQLAMGRPLTMAVNISPRQFQQNDLHLLVEQILEDSGLSPHSLELEITENVLVGDLPKPKALLEQIRSLGVHVAIDDFGTGFSSMSYVLRFRVDRLKIDQSFIREMTGDPDTHAVTNAVIALAKGLHIEVVAEGVETAAHRDLLIAKGCDEAQGYFYSRPLPMEGMCDAIYAIEHSEALAAIA